MSGAAPTRWVTERSEGYERGGAWRSSSAEVLGAATRCAAPSVLLHYFIEADMIRYAEGLLVDLRKLVIRLARIFDALEPAATF